MTVVVGWWWRTWCDVERGAMLNVVDVMFVKMTAF